MIWKSLKRILGRWRTDGCPDVGWLDSADNEWGVPVLDVSPITQSELAVTQVEEYARNAISFGGEDGRCFIDVAPEVDKSVPANLRFRTDGKLFDGVLYAPREMEQKWALFFHQNRILCVRSWTRMVAVVADVEQREGELRITAVNGEFSSRGEDGTLTCRLLDYLLRSHCLGIVYPVPLPDGMDRVPQDAAMWCMSLFGNRAIVATSHKLSDSMPVKPLRTSSLLHLAVAQGDRAAAQSHLEDGMPVDLLGQDGSAPLHWSTVQNDISLPELIIERSANVDLRSDGGETPLMWAVQDGNLACTSLLIDRGADVNAVDDSGGPVLHRAVELGHNDIVEELVRRGADCHTMAKGYTPSSLAEFKGHDEIAQFLQSENSAG